MNIFGTLKYVFPFIKKYPIANTLVFVFYGIAVILTNFIAPIIYKRIIDIISLGIKPALVAQNLFNLFYALILIIILYNIFYRLADIILIKVQSAMIFDLSTDAYKRILKHSYAFFADNFTGSLVNKTKRYLSAFETLQDKILFTFWFDFIKLLFIAVGLFIFVPGLIFVFGIWFGLFLLIIYILVRKQYKLDLIRADKEANTTGVLADAISNVLNIKIFASAKRESAYYRRANIILKTARDRAWRYSIVINTFQGIYVGILEVVAMYWIITSWINGTVSAGTIVLVQAYVLQIAGVVWNFGRSLKDVVRAFANMKDMIEIFETPPSVADPSRPKKLNINGGKIEFDNVSFAYKHGQILFDKLSFTINPGEKVGIVGHSGSGKTTITKLLLRFIDINEGKISIDGQDISKVSQDNLRENISFVPQEPLLFHRSIMENISYPKKLKLSDVKKVAKKAYVDIFAEKLPKKYQTLVGERGIKLSGGERQRIAIARAMLKDAPILILDEATSALDSISEKYIKKAFERLMKKRTTIVIAHRLSTIMKMDRIIVFDKGKIVEEGTHNELIKKDGLYKKFWDEQNEIIPD